MDQPRRREHPRQQNPREGEVREESAQTVRDILLGFTTERFIKLYLQRLSEHAKSTYGLDINMPLPAGTTQRAAFCSAMGEIIPDMDFALFAMGRGMLEALAPILKNPEAGPSKPSAPGKGAEKTGKRKHKMVLYNGIFVLRDTSPSTGRPGSPAVPGAYPDHAKAEAGDLDGDDGDDGDDWDHVDSDDIGSDSEAFAQLHQEGGVRRADKSRQGRSWV